MRENIFYFFLHFKEIQTWLLSAKFKDEFYKTKHPYPAFINPSKADYQALGADLAWGLNLPLPYRPKLVFLAIQSSGTYLAILACEFINKSKFYEANGTLGSWNAQGFWDNTNRIYKICLEQKPEFIVVGFRNYKFFNLLVPHTKVAYALRDPISLFKTAVNHIDNTNLQSGVEEFELDENSLKGDIFAKISYYGNKDNPDLDRIKLYQDKGWFGFCFDFYKSILNLKARNCELICLEFDELSTKNAFKTFLKLAKDCKFQISDESAFKKLLSHKINRFCGELLSLPIKLRASKNLSFILTTHALCPDTRDFKELTSEIFKDRKLNFNNIILLVKKQEFKFLSAEILEKASAWLNKYMNLLEQNEKKIKERLYDEVRILEYFKRNKNLALKLKLSLDKCYELTKKEYPAYIEKWKFYKEFEKICADFK